MVAAGALLACALPAAPEPGPADDLPHQTLVFYNARTALREGRAADVPRLWLVRNALADRSEGIHDDDFRSIVWAALGRLGV